MSSKLVGLVWDLDLPHNQAWVLMALVDHADHDGTKIYPSVDLIAWKTGYSPRQTQRIIASLVQAGILETVRAAGQHRPTEYRAHLDRAPRKQPLARGDKMSPITGQGRQNVTPGSNPGVTFCQSRGDILTARGDIAVSPDSHEPSEDSDPTTPMPPTGLVPGTPSAGGGGGTTAQAGGRAAGPGRTAPAPEQVQLLREAGVRAPAAIAELAALPLAHVRLLVSASRERPPHQRGGWVVTQGRALLADPALAETLTAPEVPDDQPPPAPQGPSAQQLARWGIAPAAPPGAD